jgi:hypothetical protein
MIYTDTETCGFHGPIVLIQWAEDDGPIHLHNVWHSPVRDTVQLIEYIVARDVCMFNAAFDWFHFCQMYTTMILLNQGSEPDVREYAFAEPEGRDGPCLKPKGVIDLMLHARKGPYQSTMDRDDIRIKKIPTQLAYKVADELTKRIPISNIYFAKRQDPSVRWQVTDIFDDLGDNIPDFKDVVLRFSPSSALKALAVDALGHKEVLLMKDIGVPRRYSPVEYGYAPFALSGFQHPKENRWVNIDTSRTIIDWGMKWPDVISKHITHWGYNEQARQYAGDDITYTRELHQHFMNHPHYDPPVINDDDSVLACMVGAVRWKGFSINKEAMEGLREESVSLMTETKKVFNFQSPEVCKKYLFQAMSEDERLCLTSTRKLVLEEIATWKESEVCECGMMDAECPKCGGAGLISTDTKHPAAVRANEILDARRAKKKIEILDKILAAGRFHASFDVIGALSSRMSGADGLNPQGINRETSMRTCFTLGWPGMPLAGGDFDGFEVTIVDAAYGDPTLHKELMSGKKIHGLLGVFFFPGKSYDEILASKGLPGDKDLYIRSKNGVFAIIYMGEAYTLHNRVGIPEVVAEEAFQKIIGKYHVFAQERKKYLDMFQSMRQPHGIGTKVEWHEPHDYIETMLGFRRYYTLENRVCKALFDLASDPPREWQQMNLKVTRRDRVQTACGSVRSALFAAAFAVQAANMRSAGNHVIQGTGSQLTKKLQTRLWELQPAGVNDWAILLLNIHDEVMAPCRKDLEERSKEIVKEFVEEYHEMIPLMGIEWKVGLNSWGEK